MRIKLGETTSIGRGESATVVLEDAAVSRDHAVVSRKGLGWFIEDTGSTQGTWVNRERLAGRRALLPNDEIRIGATRFLFDSDFDIQNADYTDRSVYFSSHTEDTMEVHPVAVLDAGRDASQPAGAELDFVVRLGELFDATHVGFADAMRGTCERLAEMFHTDALLFMLWDSAADSLRTTVAVSKDERFQADSAIIRRAWSERRALLVSDRREAGHPAPDAPKAPPTRSVLAAPLLAGGTAIGLLYFQRGKLDAYSLVDLRNARAVANLMAVFVEARQKAEARTFRETFRRGETRMVGSGSAMGAVLDMVGRVADSDATILITGETGTGKELLAQEVHQRSSKARARGPFVPVNCSAVPETLFESAFFGHEKGAFTGAFRMQPGILEQATGGTVFLDEIGELSPAMQPKLLRFIQEFSFSRVGGNRTLRADVRLIFATNRDLAREVAEGRFREDLYHRISVIPIHLPALRERREDIAVLAEYFAALHAKKLGRDIAGIGREALVLLEKYGWPGNIRELSNCVERAVLLADERILLPRHFSFAPAGRSPASRSPAATMSMAEVEKLHIESVLGSCDGNQVRASEVLGIHRNTLRKKIAEYGLKT